MPFHLSFQQSLNAYCQKCHRYYKWLFISSSCLRNIHVSFSNTGTVSTWLGDAGAQGQLPAAVSVSPEVSFFLPLICWGVELPPLRLCDWPECGCYLCETDSSKGLESSRWGQLLLIQLPVELP
ncbi:unnamed protein product [Rangifer tarandus platyrhynchus]|uniref:Uncharacterized protein n=1 Tax=Rangifer tarandus platyrhynchus TaxID=3082113 RepID=A0AC59Z7J7_RANTA